jgi:diguanylate cyclase (GGDEF)-like protein
MTAYGLLGSVFFLAMLISRWTHHLPDVSTVENLQHWINLHWLLVILTTGIWGMINALVLHRADFAQAHLVTVIATIAFSTAFAFTFAMHLLRCITVLCLLNLPGLAALAWGTQEQWPVFVCLAFYMVYLLLSCRRSHAEFVASIRLEQELLAQRNALEQLSRTDSLTQLGNRYQFNDLFPAMVASAQRQGMPLALVLLDIDYFKRVNDEHGHAAGDQCLQQFAELMRQMFRRDSDVPLRLGGEEFGVLMPGTTLEQAAQMAEQFRTRLAETRMDLNGPSLSITTSLGVGVYDLRLDNGADALYKRVDAALYQAKEEGRNRLKLAAGSVREKLPAESPSTL